MCGASPLFCKQLFTKYELAIKLGSLLLEVHAVENLGSPALFRILTNGLEYLALIFECCVVFKNDALCELNPSCLNLGGLNVEHNTEVNLALSVELNVLFDHNLSVLENYRTGVLGDACSLLVRFFKTVGDFAGILVINLACRLEVRTLTLTKAVECGQVMVMRLHSPNGVSS